MTEQVKFWSSAWFWEVKFRYNKWLVPKKAHNKETFSLFLSHRIFPPFSHCHAPFSSTRVTSIRIFLSTAVFHLMFTNFPTSMSEMERWKMKREFSRMQVGEGRMWVCLGTFSLFYSLTAVTLNGKEVFYPKK